MNKQQAKEYKTPSWKERCRQIILADGGACCQCGRKEPDVVLQVHHKKYVSGRKIWEYPQTDLITLCKGCHAREHNLLPDAIPQDGWIREGIDYCEEGDCCQLCGTDIRYVHSLYNPNYGYLLVGGICADELLGNKNATTAEHAYKLELQRLQRFLDSPRWKHRQNYYFYENLDNFRIRITEKPYGYYISIFYKYSREEHNGSFLEHEQSVSSKTKYESLEDAQRKIFHAITSRKIYKYLIEHSLPYPGEMVYDNYDTD